MPARVCTEHYPLGLFWGLDAMVWIGRWWYYFGFFGWGRLRRSGLLRLHNLHCMECEDFELLSRDNTPIEHFLEKHYPSRHLLALIRDGFCELGPGSVCIVKGIIKQGL
jgi:hypothetical protein